MKENLLSFIFIICRTRTFQWVTPDSNKKLLLEAQSRSGCTMGNTGAAVPTRTSGRPRFPSRDFNQAFGFRQENIDWIAEFFSLVSQEMAGLIMARHEQVAAEIHMHAEMLPVMGQQLDLVLHGVGQRREFDDTFRVRRPLERVEER